MHLWLSYTHDEIGKAPGLHGIPSEMFISGIPALVEKCCFFNVWTKISHPTSEQLWQAACITKISNIYTYKLYTKVCCSFCVCFSINLFLCFELKWILRYLHSYAHLNIITLIQLHVVTGYKQYDLIMHNVFIRLSQVMWQRFGRYKAIFLW